MRACLIYELNVNIGMYTMGKKAVYIGFGAIFSLRFPLRDLQCMEDDCVYTHMCTHAFLTFFFLQLRKMSIRKLALLFGH